MKSMTVAARNAAGKTRSRRRFGVLFAGIVTAVGVFSATSTPAFSADNGTVNATVTPAAAACLTLDKASLSFGSLQFNTPGNEVNSARQDVVVTNCAQASEKVYARGTNATNGDGTVTWSLTGDPGVCHAGSVNKLALAMSTTDGSWGIWLSTNNQQLGTSMLAASASITTENRVRMPCVGSGGAGQTMSWQYIYTATL